jgi:hypothetical protein
MRLVTFIAGVLVVLLRPALGTQAVGQVARNRLTKVEILEADQRLSELGYWTGLVDGVRIQLLDRLWSRFKK